MEPRAICGLIRDMVRRANAGANAGVRSFWHYDKEVRPYNQNVFDVNISYPRRPCCIAAVNFRLFYTFPETGFAERFTSTGPKGGDFFDRGLIKVIYFEAAVIRLARITCF